MDAESGPGRFETNDVCNSYTDKEFAACDVYFARASRCGGLIYIPRRSSSHWIAPQAVQRRRQVGTRWNDLSGYFDVAIYDALEASGVDVGAAFIVEFDRYDEVSRRQCLGAYRAFGFHE